MTSYLSRYLSVYMVRMKICNQLRFSCFEPIIWVSRFSFPSRALLPIPADNQCFCYVFFSLFIDLVVLFLEIHSSELIDNEQ